MTTKEYKIEEKVEKLVVDADKHEVPMLIAFVGNSHKVSVGITSQTPIDSICMLADLTMQLSSALDIREHDLLKDLKRVIKTAKANGVKSECQE